MNKREFVEGLTNINVNTDGSWDFLTALEGGINLESLWDFITDFKLLNINDTEDPKTAKIALRIIQQGKAAKDDLIYICKSSSLTTIQVKNFMSLPATMYKENAVALAKIVANKLGCYGDPAKLPEPLGGWLKGE